MGGPSRSEPGRVGFPGEVAGPVAGSGRCRLPVTGRGRWLRGRWPVPCTVGPSRRPSLRVPCRGVSRRCRRPPTGHSRTPSGAFRGGGGGAPGRRAPCSVRSSGLGVSLRPVAPAGPTALATQGSRGAAVRRCGGPSGFFMASERARVAAGHPELEVQIWSETDTKRQSSKVTCQRGAPETDSSPARGLGLDRVAAGR